MNREVTEEKFATFLAWLGAGGGGAGGDAAGEEYERLRFRLCTFFSQRRCRFPDELVPEVVELRRLFDRTVDMFDKATNPLLTRSPQGFGRKVGNQDFGRL